MSSCGDILSKVEFDEKGLVPAVLQDVRTGMVLMTAYMNEESLAMTLDTGTACFYSRSRGELWQKGETSGNIQDVEQILYDCDADTLLVLVKPRGPACHTGRMSCFYRDLVEEGETLAPGFDELAVLEETVSDRKKNPVEKSYTNYLFREGIDKILKKVGEENAEVIIAAKNPDRGELVYETSDLLYHLTVLLVEKGISWSEIKEELRKRK